MYKKIIFLLPIIFLVASCGDTMSSVKRGLTGEKEFSTDEFFIKKKDPLILPPDYENLPAPDEETLISEEISSFEEALETSIESTTSNPGSVETSILKQIQSK